MWENFLNPDLPIVNLIARATIVYLGVIILLRISGKKQMGQLGTTEFVAILLISNAVQNSMNGGDNTLGGGLILAVTLIALSALISYLTYRSKFFSHVFEGTPILLVHHGKSIAKNLKHELMSEDDLTVMLRKQGIHSLADVQDAVLEADGKLSITHVNDKLK